MQWETTGTVGKTGRRCRHVCAILSILLPIFGLWMSFLLRLCKTDTSRVIVPLDSAKNKQINTDCDVQFLACAFFSINEEMNTHITLVDYLTSRPVSELTNLPLRLVSAPRPMPASLVSTSNSTLLRVLGMKGVNGNSASSYWSVPLPPSY